MGSRLLILVLFLLLPGLVVVAQSQSRKDVTIAYQSWPPAKIVPAAGDSSERRGFLVDMMTDIYRRHGFTVKYSIVPYMRAISDVEQGYADLEPGTTLEISKVAVFPKVPSYVSKYVFFVRKGVSLAYKGPSTLKNLVLANVVGYEYSSIDPGFQEYLNDKSSRVVTLSGTSSIENVFSLMAQGRIDAFSEDELVGASVIQTKKLEREIEVASTLGSLRLFPAFSPLSKEKGLVQIFEDEMKKNPQLLAGFIKKYVK